MTGDPAWSVSLSVAFAAFAVLCVAAIFASWRGVIRTTLTELGLGAETVFLLVFVACCASRVYMLLAENLDEKSHLTWEIAAFSAWTLAKWILLLSVARNLVVYRRLLSNSNTSLPHKQETRAVSRGVNVTVTSLLVAAAAVIATATALWEWELNKMVVDTSNGSSASVHSESPNDGGGSENSGAPAPTPAPPPDPGSREDMDHFSRRIALYHFGLWCSVTVVISLSVLCSSIQLVRKQNASIVYRQQGSRAAIACSTFAITACIRCFINVWMAVDSYAWKSADDGSGWIGWVAEHGVLIASSIDLACEVIPNLLVAVSVARYAQHVAYKTDNEALLGFGSPWGRSPERGIVPPSRMPAAALRRT